MEDTKALSYFASPRFIGSMIVIVITGVLLFVIKKYLIKKVAYTGKDEQHRNTLIGVVFNLLQYAIVVLCVVIIMKINGANVTSILTGLGIVATIVGLALQDTLKDVISGVTIYNSNFYKVGDIVRYNGELCDVKYFSARVSKFQSIKTNSTYTVCNSTINAIEKVKDKGNMIYRFDFDIDRKKIDKAMNSIVERMNEMSFVKKIEYDGIAEMDDKGVGYEIKFLSPAHKREILYDNLAEIAYEEFKKAGIRPLVQTLFR